MTYVKQSLENFFVDYWRSDTDTQDKSNHKEHATSYVRGRFHISSWRSMGGM